MKTKDISPLHDFIKFPVNLNRQIHESIHLLNLNYMYIWLLFAANKFRVQEPLDYNCTHWSRGSPQQQIKEINKFMYSCLLYPWLYWHVWELCKYYDQNIHRPMSLSVLYHIRPDWRGYFPFNSTMIQQITAKLTTNLSYQKILPSDHGQNFSYTCIYHNY